MDKLGDRLLLSRKDLPILEPSKTGNVQLKENCRIYLKVKTSNYYDDKDRFVGRGYNLSLRLGKRGSLKKKAVFFAEEIPSENIKLPSFCLSDDLLTGDRRVSFSTASSLVFSQITSLAINRLDEKVEFALNVYGFFIRSIVEWATVEKFFSSRTALRLLSSEDDDCCNRAAQK
jgi:hypothetical protein